MMKKTQFGWIFFIVLFAITGIVIYQNNDVRTTAIVCAISFAIILLFYKLTIKVTDTDVRFYMGIGLIRGRYKIDNIANCKPLSYVPFGWGVRFKPGAILFNVSGNKAIELDMKDKFRKIWIGTNCPEEISEYVNSKRNKASN